MNNNFVLLSNQESMYVNGGCTWCKVGQTLITVGAVIATGVNPVSVTFAAVSLISTWGC